ncbi:hypothetical protein ACHAWF_005903 [Thalassiosira exigua]
MRCARWGSTAPGESQNPKGTVPVVSLKGGSGAGDVFADSELILDAVGDGRVGGGQGGLLHASGLSDEEKARVDQWRDLISNQLVPVGKSAVLGGSLPKLRSLLKELNSMVRALPCWGQNDACRLCSLPFFLENRSRIRYWRGG